MAMKVVLVTPQKELFRDQAGSVTVPAQKGIIQILPNHAPLLAVLSRGTVVIESDSGLKEFKLSSGVIEVHENMITLLVRNG